MEIKETSRDVNNKISVLIMGKIETPIIQCPKQLYHKETDSNLISVALNRREGIQKFKIPFRFKTHPESSLNSPVVVEFAFVKTQSHDRNKQIENMKLGLVDPLDCMAFFCQPNLITIQPNDQCFLNVQIKLLTSKINNANYVD